MLYKLTDLSGIIVKDLDILKFATGTCTGTTVAFKPGPRKYLDPSTLDNTVARRANLENIFLLLVSVFILSLINARRLDFKWDYIKIDMRIAIIFLIKIKL